MPRGVALDAETVAALADAVAERLEARALTRSGWVPASVVAEHLTVEKTWVYEHAEQLGALRLGDGPKARLRFRLADVDAALCTLGRESAAPPGRVVERKRVRSAANRFGTSAELMPIRGSGGGAV